VDSNRLQRARALARWVVDAELAGLDDVRSAFQDYTRRGPPREFSAHLLDARVVTREQLEWLRYQTRSSGKWPVVRPPQPAQPAASPAPSAQAVLDGGSPGRTIGFDGVLDARGLDDKISAAVAGAPAATQAYEPVLPTPGSLPAVSRQERPPTRDDDSSRGDVPSKGEVPSTSEGSLDELALSVAVDDEEAFFSESAELAAEEGEFPDVGSVLGEYALTEELGRGAMGVVFLAKRHGTAHRYAVKVLQAGRGSARKTRRQRFQREVEVLRRLDDKNLVRVYGCGRHGACDWYAMDYVEGDTLTRVLEQRRLSPADKLRVFEDIVRGVAHAHERGVVHRDLKPGNVIVTEDRDVKVLDFGLAKLALEEDERDAEPQEDLTRTGSTLGTPFYMSPEQVRSPRDVDLRSDVFSLGVLLYEMMTGRRPFQGQTAGEVGNKVINHDPPRPKKVNSVIHEDVEAICLRALEKDPERRYQGAGELLRDLVHHRRGKGVQQERLGGARRWIDRHKKGFLAGLLVASAVWIAVGAVLAALFVEL